MIYSEVNTIVYPRKMGAYNEIDKEIRPIIAKAGAKLIGSWHTILGNTNEITVIDAFEDLAQYDKFRASLASSKKYQALLDKRAPLIVSTTIKLMTANPVSPLK